MPIYKNTLPLNFCFTMQVILLLHALDHAMIWNQKTLPGNTV